MRASRPLASLARRIMVRAAPSQLTQMNDGCAIPQLGLGTAKMSDAEAYTATRAALDAGYRHIAMSETSDAAVGRALRDSGIPRADVFLTYLSPSLRTALDRAALSYVDLTLLSSQGGPHARAEGWITLVEARRKGLTRSVGVSGYGMLHLAEVVEMVRRAGEDGPGAAMPAVNRLAVHPLARKMDVVEMCAEMGTAVYAEAGGRVEHSVIAKMAEKYGQSPEQVVLRWGIQHDHIVTPESAVPEHIAANAQVFDFEIAPEDMAELDGLNEERESDLWADE
ncbi:Aldo/keto reductase [Cutaneotrichosporon oleaginosum]|uniref:Aldo/keto reductase n=1 Tax=Cutaneotrichosporon oleaginosum TaxID=879819 RepID=A0A0J0XHM3_9TREE|nr:Aldo/keto reductase [Cutaneotrichosporon oleaginosum]KLT40507.1 Aldo/keto reductase [Cutaneotrichosporon oleaginosum]TXT08421.1 hypothetical protein COLE_05345 [Cutaneotrichosporon oleaginosum]